MRILKIILFALSASVLYACTMKNQDSAQEGTFAYDLHFLKQHDSVLVLKNDNGNAQIIVSPKYQAKVFTSTTDGESGKSMGWINYKVFDQKEADPHMNAFGGEDRLWLGPEGSKYSLFFKPGTEMSFENWHTPAAIDKESWHVKGDSCTPKSIYMVKTTQMQNYAGTVFDIKLDRVVLLQEDTAINNLLGIRLDSTVKAVGYTTFNTITNVGKQEWNKETGAPCMWNLDMFNPSTSITIVIPYELNTTGEIATTDYFGKIPPARIKFINGTLYFKADGKQRGKLGLPPNRVKSYAGSYDADNGILTIITYDFNPNATYLNQEWRIDKDPFKGDAVNAYNDGPLADGSQMGPFYEIESVSPAAFLKSGEKLTHKHSVFHFTGDKSSLNVIALKTLGVGLKDIQAAFK
jgi:hypothetical protein